MKGRPITGNLSDTTDSSGRAFIHHAGTGTSVGTLISTGGRVLAATGIAPSLTEARKLAYQKLSEVELEGAHFRRDIGHRAL